MFEYQFFLVGREKGNKNNLFNVQKNEDLPFSEEKKRKGDFFF